MFHKAGTASAMNADHNHRDIFFVIGSLNIGGTEIHLSIVAPELVKRGFTVTIYNLSGNGVLGDQLIKQGVKLLGPPLRFSPAGSKLRKFPLLALSGITLFLVFLFQRPRIVHFFLPEAYVVGAIMACFARHSRLIMSRRSLNNYQSRRPTLARIERHLHRFIRVILGNSRRVVEQLHNEESVPAEKLRLIYNGVPVDRYTIPFDRAKKRAALGIAPNTKIFVIVANLIPYKGHADLLNAISGIEDELPEHWQLLIVGRDDGIGADLKRLAAIEGVDDKVEFLGVRNDVPDLLRISDLAILCSHEEGFSNFILEAMAAGLPVIVTDVGGNAEAVRDGVTGIVVPPHSPSYLGAAILRLAKDEQLAMRMGQAARQRVQELFSLEACVSQYVEVYSAVAADRDLAAAGGRRETKEVL